MKNLGRTAAIILATLLVAVTPVVAFADVGPKNQLSITESQLLAKVNTLMGTGNEYEESNHGGIVSVVAQKDLEDLEALIKEFVKDGEKITRGRIISILARSDAGKANNGKSEEAKASTDDSDKEKKDKDEKVVGQARADANRAAAAAAATAREDDGDDQDDEEKGQGRSNEKKQGANSHGNADLDDDEVTTTGDETGSRGQGRGNQNR